MPQDNETNSNKRATYNVIISYTTREKVIMTLLGFNKEQVRREILETYKHIPDLVVETIDLIDGEETNTDNVVEFTAKEEDQKHES